MMNFKQIYDGWTNLLRDKFDVLDEDVKKQAIARLEICYACPMITNGICDRNKREAAVKNFTYGKEKRFSGRVYKGCGCNLAAKTRTPEAKCPLGKW